MPFIFFILIFISQPLLAEDSQDELEKNTLLQEKNLLEKYKIVPSTWLEGKCMELAYSMEFKLINQCQIIDSPKINAYVLANGHVYFSLAMMQQIKNKHQWAAILAHENAHLELNHHIKTLEKIQNPGFFFPQSKIKKMMKKNENQADDWAENRLKEKNFDPNQIYFFMQRVIKLKGNNKSNSHIKPSKRINKNNTTELIDSELTNIIELLN